MNIEKALENLNKHGFSAKYFAAGADAANYLCETLQDTSVGFGGSMTCKELGLYEKLKERNRVYWHWMSGDCDAPEKAAAEADVYILSANALSETGEIVNIDGTGNRLAASLYAHKKVIFVVGKNKLTEDLPAAIDRARNVASPLNARRLGRKTPCVLTEPMRCHDCSSPERICRGLLVLYERMNGVGEMEVLLVGEELGY